MHELNFLYKCFILRGGGQSCLWNKFFKKMLWFLETCFGNMILQPCMKAAVLSFSKMVPNRENDESRTKFNHNYLFCIRAVLSSQTFLPIPLVKRSSVGWAWAFLNEKLPICYGLKPRRVETALLAPFTKAPRRGRSYSKKKEIPTIIANLS